MVKITLKNEQLELATSLRVAFALRDMCGAKNLQEAIQSISGLDIEGRIDLMYAAYRAGSGKDIVKYTKEEFKEAILDEFGLFALTNVINQLMDGILYSGMSEEEIAAKKLEVEKEVQKQTVGEISSDEATV